MADEIENKDALGKKLCKFGKAFQCAEVLEAAGCEVCLGVQNRDLNLANYQNIQAIIQILKKKPGIILPEREKITIDLNKLRGG